MITVVFFNILHHLPSSCFHHGSISRGCCGELSIIQVICPEACLRYFYHSSWNSLIILKVLLDFSTILSAFMENKPKIAAGCPENRSYESWYEGMRVYQSHQYCHFKETIELYFQNMDQSFMPQNIPKILKCGLPCGPIFLKSTTMFM